MTQSIKRTVDQYEYLTQRHCTLEAHVRAAERPAQENTESLHAFYSVHLAVLQKEVDNVIYTTDRLLLRQEGIAIPCPDPRRKRAPRPARLED